MKSKIALAFDNCKREKRPALITYTVAGDSTKEISYKILNKISQHADILELGFPHNTPIADGGQIQGSSHRALSKGIKKEQIIIDPGIGFAKNVDQNLALLRNLEDFVSMNHKVLIGPSRKRFIGSIINEPEPKKRIFGTAAVASRCVIAGVDILRVHDVKQIAQTILMTKSII